MDAPKCKICKERHYGLCAAADVFVETRQGIASQGGRGNVGTAPARSVPATRSKASVGKPSISDQRRQDKPRNDVVNNFGTERVISTPAKAKFDRVAYQRNYMRDVYRPRKAATGKEIKT